MAKNDKQENTAISDFNLEKITTKQLEANLAASLQVGSSVAIFGRRGTGKTEISKQQIKNAGYHEVYLNLSVLERVDMGGYPDMLSAQRKEEFVNFMLPKFYEPMMKENHKPVVALLDEVDKADPSLWAPLLEFVQFKSINGRPLPNLKSVIMTGNLVSEGGSRPSLPLLDRAEKYLVEADVQSWLEWSGRSGKVHPSITAYISDHPKDLFGAVDPDDRYADASPRGWSGASELLFAGEERNWSSDLLLKKVAGRVGKQVGLKYALYYEHYQVLLPMVAEIFEGTDVRKKFDKLEPTKKLISCMIACARLANVLDGEKEKVREVSTANVGKFLQHVPSENVLVAVRSQIQIDRIVRFGLDEHPQWESVLNKINQQVSAS